MSVETSLDVFVSRVRADAPGLGALGPHVYARLLRGRFQSAVTDVLPRTVAALGAARVDAWVRAFLAEGAAGSPLYRDLAADMLDFLLARPALLADAQPAIAELAHYELARFRVALAEADAPAEEPLAPERGVRFSRASCLFRAAHRVHGDGEAEPTSLLLFRPREPGGVRCLVLSALADGLLTDLYTGASLGAAVARAAPPDGDEGARLGECAALLADLAELGVVLGGASL